MSTLAQQRGSVFVVYSNTDLTEGRGHDYPTHVCELEFTALRLARKEYVQGSDAPVREIELLKHEGVFYMPLRAVPMVRATEGDVKEDERLQRTREIKQKMLDAGVSQSDIDYLIRK